MDEAAISPNLTDNDMDSHPSHSLSMEVVDAVARKTGKDAVELPPLHDFIDPDALDAMYSSSGRSEAADIGISFRYMDCRIEIDRNENITIQQRD